jgi:hypothetical protein
MINHVTEVNHGANFRPKVEPGFKITNPVNKRKENIAQKYNPEKRTNNKYVFGNVGLAKLDNMPKAELIAKADRMKKMVN